MISNKKDLAKLKKSLREVELALAASQKGDFTNIFLSHCPPFSLDNDQCWEWNGTLKHGCSVFFVGLTGRNRFKISARRLSYSLFRSPIALQPITYDNHLRNTCKNTTCVRPSHLENKIHVQTIEEAFFKYCSTFTINDGRCWEWKKGKRFKFNIQGKRRHVLPRRIAFHLFSEPVPLLQIVSGQEVNSECLNDRCIRPSHLWYGSYRKMKAEKMSRLKIAIGERLWWLWNVKERVQIRKKAEGNIFYRHKIIQPHKDVVLLAIQTLAVLLQCKESSIWTWIRPSRKASLRLEPPKRVYMPRGTNHAPKIYKKRKLKPDFIEWEYKPHGKEKGKQKI